jgi:hypothetical protein
VEPNDQFALISSHRKLEAAVWRNLARSQKTRPGKHRPLHSEKQLKKLPVQFVF